MFCARKAFTISYLVVYSDKRNLCGVLFASEGLYPGFFLLYSNVYQLNTLIHSLSFISILLHVPSSCKMLTLRSDVIYSIILALDLANLYT